MLLWATVSKMRLIISQWSWQWLKEGVIILHFETVFETATPSRMSLHKVTGYRHLRRGGVQSNRLFQLPLVFSQN